MISGAFDLLCTASHRAADNDGTQLREIQTTSPYCSSGPPTPTPFQVLLFIIIVFFYPTTAASLDQNAAWFKLRLPAAANTCQSNCEAQTIYSYYFLWAPLHYSSSHFLTIQMRVGVKMSFLCNTCCLQILIQWLWELGERAVWHRTCDSPQSPPKVSQPITMKCKKQKRGKKRKISQYISSYS